MTLFIIQVVVAFIALFITDICWAFYVNRVKDGNAFASAMWAVSLFLTGAFGVISYVTNAWLLIPAAAGAFCGTYVAVLLEKRKKNDRSVEIIQSR